MTRALLRVDFDLELHIPPDRLCPPIPNRWNYVAWIQSLLDSTNPTYHSAYDPDRKIVGLDIGTGASAIYTMLCLRSRPKWIMCATDVDKKSFDAAVQNLTINGLVTRTKMLHTSDANPLIPLQYLGVDHLDFTICNPPFFLDEADMRKSMQGEGKTTAPNAVCTGSLGEMACPGGDLGFVTRIVEESLVLRDKVTWYTSMLGKLSSAKSIVELLKKHDVGNWAVGCIDTGGATKRWIVAWSFGDLRPRIVSA
jgi:23S rRNA (adenine1618-N6)-methyltransferase